MKRLIVFVVLVTAAGLSAWVAPARVAAHGGGLDGQGCHNDRQRGGYHCHRGALAGQAFGSSSEAAAALARLNTRGESTALPRTVVTPAPTGPAVAIPLTSRPAPIASTTGAALCALNRLDFERMVSLRMQTYESTADSWSAVALLWRRRIDANVASTRATPELDAAFGRYSRYCAEGDAFMAGLMVGEWVGVTLHGPTAAAVAEPETPGSTSAPLMTQTQGPPPQLRVSIQRVGDGWRLTNESPGYTWTPCEAQVGASTALLPPLQPNAAVTVTRTLFTPALRENGQLWVTCRPSEGVSFVATESR